MCSNPCYGSAIFPAPCGDYRSVQRNGDGMASDGSPEFEIVEEVKADTVKITHAGAALVQANTVTVTQAGVQRIEASQVTLAHGGAAIIESETMELSHGGAGFLVADNVDVKHSGLGISFADTVHAQDSIIGVLFAGHIEGTPDIKFDARRAAAFGAGATVALFLLRRFFPRR